MDYLKEFTTKLQNLDRSKNIATVFKDFLLLSTSALAQPFYKSDNIEQKYLETIKHYTKEQAEEFTKLLAFLVQALEQEHQDFLGKVYMQLNIGNTANGQFFTPYHVSKFMSEVSISNNVKNLKNEEVITLNEPCCGSGGMIIAFADTLKSKNINYQKHLFVESIDIDEICFMMTYLQLTLLGIPARVILGNTITLKFQKILYTSMYFINGFYWKLKEIKQAKIKSEQEIIKEVIRMKQLSLF